MTKWDSSFAKTWQTSMPDGLGALQLMFLKALEYSRSGGFTRASADARHLDSAYACISSDVSTLGDDILSVYLNASLLKDN